MKMGSNELEQRLAASMLSVKNGLRRLFAPVSARTGITFFQAMILNSVRRGELSEVGDVCRLFEINQGNASTLCKRLESAGFITRRRSREDERRVKLSLTDKGLEALSGFDDEIGLMTGELSKIPGDRLKTITDGLDELDRVIAEITSRSDTASESETPKKQSETNIYASEAGKALHNA